MDKTELTIVNDIARLRELQAFVEETADAWELSMKVSMNINLVLEEIISNIIFYGYEDDGVHVIRIELMKADDAVKIIITDDAAVFDILAAEEFADNEKAAEDRKIGGLGIHFVKTLMDKVEYRRENEQNILSLIKKI